MRITTLLHASPLLLGLALGISAGCGGKVIGGNGGGGNGGNGTGAGGGAGGFAACDGPGQCVIVNNGCCDPCGAPDLSTVAAVNGAYVDAFHQSVCPEQPPCPKCATGLNPNLFAYCDAGTCRAADARTHEVSACGSDADCMLRYGTGCCEGCGSDAYGLVALSQGSDFLTLVCGGNVPCPTCEPLYPAEASAVCSAGHCAVQVSGTASP